MSQQAQKTGVQKLVQHFIKVSGDRTFVWWREHSGTYWAGVVVFASTTNQTFLVKSLLGDYRIFSRSRLTLSVPLNISAGNAMEVANHLGDLDQDFETVADVLIGTEEKRVKVKSVHFIPSSWDQVKIYVSGRFRYVAVSKLSAIPVESTDEVDSKSEESETPEVALNLVATLSKSLNKPGRTFVWWKSQVGQSCGGHIVFQKSSSTFVVVRSMYGQYSVRRGAEVSQDVPADMSQEEMDNFVGCYRSLMQEYEVEGNVRKWSTWQRSYYWQYEPVTMVSIINGKVKVRLSSSSYSTQVLEVDKLRDVVVDGSVSAQEVDQARAEVRSLETKVGGLEKSLAATEEKLEKATSAGKKLKSRIQTAEQRAESLIGERNKAQRKSSELSAKLQDKTRSANELRAEVQSLSGMVEEWTLRHSQVMEENRDVKRQLNDAFGENRLLKMNERAFEEQKEVYLNTLKKNEDLRKDIAQKDAKLSEYRVVPVDCEYRSFNLKSELKNLRNQHHDSALEVCASMGLPEEGQFHLLMRIFTFVYSHFEERLELIRRLLGMDKFESLEALFVGRLQENYLALIDQEELVNRFDECFWEELGTKNVKDVRMVDYVLSCGHIAWHTVLRTPKLVFKPLQDDVLGGQVEVAFDKKKFSDYADGSNRGKNVVVQYVLPGVYRADEESAKPIVMPCVRIEAVRRSRPGASARSSLHEEPSVTESGGMNEFCLDDMKSELGPIEEKLQMGKKHTVRRLLREVGVDVEKFGIVIGCAHEECDHIFATTYQEFVQVSRGKPMFCPQDEDHEGVTILSVALLE